MCVCVSIYFPYQIPKKYYEIKTLKKKTTKHSNDYRKQVDEKHETENSKTLVYLDSVIMGMFFQ